jgi:hypothetical protein
MRIHILRKLTFLLLLLSTAGAVQVANAEDNADPEEPLSGEIDYWFVGHCQQRDSAGRLLAWEATIEDDVHGKMKWWFVIPPPRSPITFQGGRSTFYAARWGLWVDDELVLAGETAEKTFFPDGADGIWDGHGRVTEAEGRFNALVGRKVYDTGPVILGEDPPKTYTGTGLFLIY